MALQCLGQYPVNVTPRRRRDGKNKGHGTDDIWAGKRVMCLQPDWQKWKLAHKKKFSCSRQYGKFFLVRLFSFQVGIFLSSRFVPEDYDRICFENQDKNLMQTSPFPQTTAGRKASNKSEYGLAELTDLHKWFLELTLPSMQVSCIVRKKFVSPHSEVHNCTKATCLLHSWSMMLYSSYCAIYSCDLFVS